MTKDKAVGKIIYSKSVRTQYKTEHFLSTGNFPDKKSNAHLHLKFKISKPATKTRGFNTDIAFNPFDQMSFFIDQQEHLSEFNVWRRVFLRKTVFLMNHFI